MDNTGTRIEESMTAHASLKRAWAEFKEKDCVDAYHNAVALLQACKERMESTGITPQPTPNPLADHILAMADDAYLVGHPEWAALVEEAKQTNAY